MARPSKSPSPVSDRWSTVCSLPTFGEWSCRGAGAAREALSFRTISRSIRRIAAAIIVLLHVPRIAAFGRYKNTFPRIPFEGRTPAELPFRQLMETLMPRSLKLKVIVPSVLCAALVAAPGFVVVAQAQTGSMAGAAHMSPLGDLSQYKT